MRSLAQTFDNAAGVLAHFAVDAKRARFSVAMAGLQQTPAPS